ncbi:MAG: hypothetical protein ACJA2O_002519, partial [Candidatus Azotimanducaceae bacterium]
LRISLTWSEATSVFFHARGTNAFMLLQEAPSIPRS